MAPTGRSGRPELDEPITSMGFVERAEILENGTVEVDFRLPTYWCSPNFAFLMLNGIREAMENLSWRPVYRIRLHDHLMADEVNEGISNGKSFTQIVGELANDCNLDELRNTFAGKAFKRRQEAVILGLRERGLRDGEILGLDLAGLDEESCEDVEMATQKHRYRQALLKRYPDLKVDAPVFVTWEGVPILEENLKVYLRELSAIRINMEFNGVLCRGLKNTRYKEMEVIDGEPTLVDFIVGSVPATAAPSPGTKREATGKKSSSRQEEVKSCQN
ncbi:hypothetical protein HED51_22560 [Ochrobactrum grignonense]|nr:hypothetical protein [Brucella grignonensis]